MKKLLLVCLIFTGCSKTKVEIYCKIQDTLLKRENCVIRSFAHDGQFVVDCDEDRFYLPVSNCFVRQLSDE